MLRNEYNKNEYNDPMAQQYIPALALKVDSTVNIIHTITALCFFQNISAKTQDRV